MNELTIRLDEPLAEAVKAHAAMTGESVNAVVTRLLRVAVDRRQA